MGVVRRADEVDGLEECASDVLRVGIAYYGAGNIGALAQALLSARSQVSIVRSRGELEAVDVVVLPGVGAMASAMEALTATGLGTGIRRWAESGRPLLGVCLGMQMLVGESEEGGRGLGLLEGRTCRLPAGRVPNLGWCEVRPVRDAALFRGWPGPSYTYFAHSYAVVDTEPAAVAATASLGDSATGGVSEGFVAAVGKGNIWGVQFHPERSGEAGRQVLKAFLAREKRIRRAGTAR